MTCSVSKLPGLTRTPTAQWLNNAMGNKGIILPTPNEATLTFSPLKTSHAGTYRCQGNISTTVHSQPLSDSSDIDLIVQSKSDIHCYILLLSNDYCFFFSVPKPTINIFRYPSSSPLFANLSEVVFTCQVSINTNIDTPVNLSLSWTREVYDNKDDTTTEVITMNSTTSTVERSWTPDRLSSNDQRVTCNGTISSASSFVQGNSGMYEDTLSVAGRFAVFIHESMIIMISFRCVSDVQWQCT